MAKNPKSEQSTTATQQQNVAQQQDTTQHQTQQTQQDQSQTSLQQMIASFLNQDSTAQNTTGQQNTNQAGTQTTNLSSFQQPVAQQYFQDLMNKYTSGNLGGGVYTGERVAGLTPEQQQAQQMATSYATGGGTNFANQALATGSHLMDPNQMLNPANIPGLQASKDTNATSLTRQLTEGQLPQIRNEALLTGGYGGSRQGIAEGLAMGRTNEAIANANAGMDMQAYSQGLQAMQNALGMAPQTLNAGTQPANIVAQVGQQNQAQNQAQNMANQQQFNEQQAAPGNLLSMVQQLMGVQGQYGGSTQTQQTGQQTGTEATTGQSTQQGTSQQMNIGQQIAQMLGLSTGDMSGSSTGTSSGTSTGTQTGTMTSKPSFLQQLGAIASIFMMPFTMGGSSQGLAAAGGPGGWGGGGGGSEVW